MQKNNPKYVFMLLLTAMIWGSAFVAQSKGNDFLGPFTFDAARNVIGGLVLIPLIPLLKRFSGREGMPETAESKKALWVGGIGCGLLLGLASSLQQWGILYASVGKAGFITSMYIVIVPVLGIFVKRNPGLKVWIAVAISVWGLYLLCWGGGGFGLGEVLLFGCSLLFSLHILLVDRFSPKVDGLKLSCVQFCTAGVLCTILAFLFETPSLSAILSAAGPILYAGVLSSGVAYTLQIIAQKRVEPTLASLVLSLESVFSVLCGWIILHEALSMRELMGCVLMFGAIVLAQLPDRKKAEVAGAEA